MKGLASLQSGGLQASPSPYWSPSLSVSRQGQMASRPSQFSSIEFSQMSVTAGEKRMLASSQSTQPQDGSVP